MHISSTFPYALLTRLLVEKHSFYFTTVPAYVGIVNSKLTSLIAYNHLANVKFFLKVKYQNFFEMVKLYIALQKP